MKCKNCSQWQGTRGAKWGDCYRVIAYLEPRLLDCYKVNEEGMIVEFWDVPFDPHEVKYWNNHKEFCKLYKNAGKYLGAFTRNSELDGIRIVMNQREDILFDNNGGEKLGTIKYKYFQTNKDFECPLDPELGGE